MACDVCGSNRVMSVTGKCSDMCGILFQDKDYDGYVPNDLNIGGGDYIEFDVCLDCGKLQGEFPIEDPKL